MASDFEQIAILHISDLHFAQVLANNEFEWIKGWNGHDLTLCMALKPALDDAFDFLQLSELDKLHIVVSGDLTAAGTAKEFAVAHSFVRGKLRINRTHRSEIGLNALDKHIVSVPGNHDHWAGKKFPPKAYTPGIMIRHFEPTPWVAKWFSPGGKLEVEVYGIDSNSIFASGETNLLAKGGFSQTELTRVEDLLTQSTASTTRSMSRRVRILVTHHSLSYIGGGVLRREELEDSSQSRILDLAAKYHLVAVLTGHTHDYFCKPFNLHQDRSPWEFRSSTTFQGPPKPDGQGFWMYLLAPGWKRCYLDRSKLPLGRGIPFR